MSSAPSKPVTLDIDNAGAPTLSSSAPTSSMILTACVAFFVALSIYFAVTESPGRINHDMSEAFAWGREFQLGYPQHPPFWAWICGAWFQVFPHEIWAFGILSSLNATIGLFGAWLLIGDFADGRKREAATALLLLTPCYTFFAFKYEGSHQLLSATNLTHLQALGGSGNYGQATNSLIAVGQCANLQLADLCRDPGTNEEAGLSWFSGLGTTLTDTRPLTLVSYGAAGPQLSIATTGTNVLLSWPMTTVPFQLQTNVTLNESTTWSPTEQIPVSSGGSNFIGLPASSATGFFRLIQNR